MYVYMYTCICVHTDNGQYFAQMYVCIYTYVYVYVYLYVCAYRPWTIFCTNICMYIYLCMCVCILIYVCIQTMDNILNKTLQVTGGKINEMARTTAAQEISCLNVSPLGEHVCMYACMHVCMYACIICMFMCMYIRTCIHAGVTNTNHIHMYTSMYVLYTHTHKICIYTYVNSYIHAVAHRIKSTVLAFDAYIHTHINCIHRYIHAYTINYHIYKQTNTNSCIHTGSRDH